MHDERAGARSPAPPDAAAQLEALWNAPIGIGFLDAELRYLRVNEALARLNGSPAAAHVGRTGAEMIPAFAGSLDPLLRRVLETGTPIVGLEVSTAEPGAGGVRPGRRRWWNLNYYPTRDADGRVNGIGILIIEETAARRAEARAARILEEMPDGFVELDHAGVVQQVNAEASRLLDAPRDALVGRRFADVLGWEALAAAAGTDVRLATLPAPRGRWLELRATRGEDATLVFLRDVTAERDARLVAADERERLSRILDELPIGVALAESPSGRILLGNRALNAIWARPVVGTADVEGYRAFPATHLDGTPLAPEDWPIARTIRSGAPEEGTQRIRRADGHEVVIHSRTAPLRDDVGRLTGVLATVEDVTARIAADEALKASEARFRFLADSVPEIVWTARTDGSLSYVNRRGVELTGRAPGTRGLSWVELVHPDDRARTQATLARAVDTGEPLEFEYRLRTVGGEFRWMRVRGRPMRDASGAVVQWFGTTSDIHDFRLALDALQRSVRAREEFIAVASHELRTPLAALLLHFASLEQQVNVDAERLRLLLPGRLSSIRQQLQRMSSLVNQLLDASRLAAGRFGLVLQRVDLASLVREVVERLAPVAMEQGSTLTSTSVRELRLRCDPVRIDQVLVNLVSNAIRYGEGRPVEVHLDVADGMARVRVVDHGIGIDEALQARIFERFERVASVHHESGFGLGLWIASEIVKAHGGALSVASRPGEGATFTLQLPVELG